MNAKHVCGKYVKGLSPYHNRGEGSGEVQRVQKLMGGGESKQSEANSHAAGKIRL